jgi:putative mRNA 3-end processing factor
MKLKFFGGAQEVGRSAIFLKDEKSFMFDFGIKLGEPIEHPIGLPQADAVILSHAHLDHSGYVPTFYNHMRIPTFGTEPTRELAELLLKDSLKISRLEHRSAGFHKHQLQEFMKRYVSLGYHTRRRMGNFEIEMYDAGHICGSAVTMLEKKGSKGRRIVYTGDFKIEKQLLHNGAEAPECDVLITESTYALHNHPDRNALIKRFIEKIKEVLDNGGMALVPSFAVGRGQELLALLEKNGLSDRTYVDGMINKATDIVLRNKSYIANPKLLQNAFDKATRIRTGKDRENVGEDPAIILTTAGMLEGGPVLNYITRLNDQSHIFLTGYQVEGTNGRSLMEHGTMEIDGEMRRIKTPLSFYDLSAHAGVDDIYEFIRRSSPAVVCCVHGSEENTTGLATALKERGFKAYAPKLGDTIDLGE